jgi:hypothetical protein
MPRRLIALIGILWFHEAASPLRVLFIANIQQRRRRPLRGRQNVEGRLEN